MLSLLTSALLMAAPAAHAHEVAVEVAALGAPSDGYQLFSNNGAASLWGLRGGFSFNRHLSLVGGYHTGRTGLDVYADLPEQDGGYDDYGDGYLMLTGLVNHRATLGVKAALPLKPWLAPYVTAQAMGWFSTARFDDDGWTEGSFNERTYRAFAPGGLFTGGVQVRPLRLGRSVRVAAHLELGYGITGRLRFEDDDNRDAAGNGPVSIGELQFRGLSIGSGVGVTF